MRTLTQEEVHEVAAFLEGSSGTMDNALEHLNVTEDDLDPKSVDDILSHVTSCVCCGWWASAVDMDDEGNCDECHTQNLEDEEDDEDE